MKGFGRRKKPDYLERLLRDDRPAPPKEFIDEITSRIVASRPAPPTRAPLRRLGLACVAAVVMLAVFAAFGGAGLAASGVSGATTSTVDAVVTLVKPERSTSGSAVAPAKQAAVSSAKHTSSSSRGQTNSGQSVAPTTSSGLTGSTSSSALSIRPLTSHGGGDFCDKYNRFLSAAHVEYCHPRITICHNGQTVTLPIIVAIYYLVTNRNDYLGPCRPPPPHYNPPHHR